MTIDDLSTFDPEEDITTLSIAAEEPEKQGAFGAFMDWISPHPDEQQQALNREVMDTYREKAKADVSWADDPNASFEDRYNSLTERAIQAGAKSPEDAAAYITKTTREGLSPEAANQVSNYFRTRNALIYGDIPDRLQQAAYDLGSSASGTIGGFARLAGKALPEEYGGKTLDEWGRKAAAVANMSNQAWGEDVGIPSPTKLAGDIGTGLMFPAKIGKGAGPWLAPFTYGGPGAIISAAMTYGQGGNNTDAARNALFGGGLGAGFGVVGELFGKAASRYNNLTPEQLRDYKSLPSKVKKNLDTIAKESFGNKPEVLANRVGNYLETTKQGKATGDQVIRQAVQMGEDEVAEGFLNTAIKQKPPLKSLLFNEAADRAAKYKPGGVLEDIIADNTRTIANKPIVNWRNVKEQAIDAGLNTGQIESWGSMTDDIGRLNRIASISGNTVPLSDPNVGPTGNALYFLGKAAQGYIGKLLRYFGMTSKENRVVDAIARSYKKGGEFDHRVFNQLMAEEGIPQEAAEAISKVVYQAPKNSRESIEFEAGQRGNFVDSKQEPTIIAPQEEKIDWPTLRVPVTDEMKIDSVTNELMPGKADAMYEVSKPFDSSAYRMARDYGGSGRIARPGQPERYAQLKGRESGVGEPGYKTWKESSMQGGISGNDMYNYLQYKKGMSPEDAEMITKEVFENANEDREIADYFKWLVGDDMGKVQKFVGDYTYPGQNMYSAGVGLGAGVDIDENGNITFDPVKAAEGAAIGLGGMIVSNPRRVLELARRFGPKRIFGKDIELGNIKAAQDALDSGVSPKKVYEDYGIQSLNGEVTGRLSNFADEIDVNKIINSDVGDYPLKDFVSENMPFVGDKSTLRVNETAKDISGSSTAPINDTIGRISINKANPVNKKIKNIVNTMAHEFTHGSYKGMNPTDISRNSDVVGGALARRGQQELGYPNKITTELIGYMDEKLSTGKNVYEILDEIKASPEFKELIATNPEFDKFVSTTVDKIYRNYIGEKAPYLAGNLAEYEIENPDKLILYGDELRNAEIEKMYNGSEGGVQDWVLDTIENYMR